MGDLVQVKTPVLDTLDPAFFIDRKRQAVGQQNIGAGEGHTPFQQVLQLTDITREIIFFKKFDGIGRYFGHLLAHFLGIFIQKMLGQKLNVRLAFPQGRNLDFNDIETIKKVLPEPPVDDILGQVAVGGGNDADVNGYIPGITHGLEGFFLDSPQEFDLKLLVDFPYFVQKDRALVCCFQQAFFILGSTCKGTLFMPEKLTFHEGFRYSAAIDDDKRLVISITFLVNGPGNQFLAGTAFTGDKDIGPRIGHLADHIVDIHHTGTVSHDFTEMKSFMVHFTVQRPFLLLGGF